MTHFRLIRLLLFQAGLPLRSLRFPLLFLFAWGVLVCVLLTTPSELRAQARNARAHSQGQSANVKALVGGTL